MTAAAQAAAPLDLAIIGAGVFGCALFREFALAGLRVGPIERGADILSSASKAHSALLHTGFDAVPGSSGQPARQPGGRPRARRPCAQ